jgi:hypothetical protein
MNKHHALPQALSPRELTASVPIDKDTASCPLMNGSVKSCLWTNEAKDDVPVDVYVF